MARAGETPSPEFRRGDNALPYGGATQANQLRSLIGPVPDNTEPVGMGQLSSPVEQFLTSPTARPAEPITAGAPFGPGRIAVNFRSDQDVVTSVAQQLMADPNASKDSKTWAARALAGD